MSRLIITQGPGTGRAIIPSPNGVVIGRQREVEVSLDSAAVSRRHARVTWEDGAVFVEDLGSSNGTFVDDLRITRKTRLLAGSILRVGPTVLQLDAPAKAPLDMDMTIQRQTAANTANVELFQDTSGTKLQAVLQLAHHLNQTVDGDSVLERLLDQLLVLFPGADRALVILKEGEEPMVKALRQRRAGPSAAPLFSRSVLRKVFSQGVGVLASDTRLEQSTQANFTLNQLGIQSLLCAPLQGQGGRILGALQLDRSRAGEAFSQDDLYLLAAVSIMVSSVLENARMYQAILSAERVQRDLALAREIQLGYLPRGGVQLAAGAVELVAELHPALEVSGDFYDYFPLPDGRLAFAVADVSGKGMAAALFMTLVHALGRHLAQAVTRPADLIARLNDAVAQDNPNFMFVTLAFGIYDAATGEVVLAHGGHPPAFVRRRDGRVEELSYRGAPLLGMQQDIRRSEEGTVHLQPGDVLLLYTDGVTESPGQSNPNELFGPGRLTEALRNLNFEKPLATWTAELRQSVALFSGTGPLADDITLLALRRPVERAE